MKLYINTSFDARESLVVSETQNTQTSIQTLFNGDSLPLEILFVDGQGNVDWTFNSVHIENVKVAIGDLDQQTIVAFIDGLSQHSNNFWQGTLQLGTEEISNQLLGQEELQFHFEVQVIKKSGTVVTTNQSLVTIRNQLILFSSQMPNLSVDQFVDDPFAEVSSGIKIRIKSNFTIGQQEFETDQIYTTTNASTQNETVKVTINGEDFWIGQRGERYEIISEPANVTPEPVPSYNDSFVGRWVEVLDDTFRNDGLSNGDVVQITSISTNGENLLSNNSYFPSSSEATLWQFTTEPDSDNDGVADSQDYFPNDQNYTQTKAELDSYSLDPHRTPVVGDVVRILENFNKTEHQGTNTFDFVNGEYHIISNKGTNWIRVNVDNSDYQFWNSDRTTKWEIVNPASDLTIFTPTPYYVWGDDNTHGEGYFYPVYLETTGLSSYHSHTINGVVYYMEDNSANHATSELPSDNTLPIAPNTSDKPDEVDLYIDNYYNGFYMHTKDENGVPILNHPILPVNYNSVNPTLDLSGNIPTRVTFHNGSNVPFVLYGTEQVFLVNPEDSSGVDSVASFTFDSPYSYIYSADDDPTTGKSQASTEGYFYV